MNSINLLGLSVNFNNPWLLFLLIPAVVLMLIPYLRLPKQHRNTRNRVISLVLHSVILVLMVLLVSGLSFTYTRSAIKSEVILLVDASDSAEVARDEMDEFVADVVKEIDGEHKVGIVTFGGDTVYCAGMSNNSAKVLADYFAKTEAPDGTATDMDGALQYARTLISSPVDGRIIIISDGRQTDGNAETTAKTLADEGIKIDTVYFPSVGKFDEAQITTSETTREGGVAELLVTVNSTVSQRVNVILYDGDELLSEQLVQLDGGEQILSLELNIADTQMHVIKSEIVPERDTISHNNVSYAFLNNNASTKTLLVDGTGDGAPKLNAALSEEFEVTTVIPERLTTSAEELKRYGEVILLNVANDDLNEAKVAALKEYVEAGGGLFTIGGDKAYNQEDMEGTAYQELLPVEANTDPKSLALMIIIDVSTGMFEEGKTDSGATRIELAKEAAIESIEALAPDDYIGIMTFNQEAKMITEMTQLTDTNKPAIIRSIRNIEFEKMGTVYSRALQLAGDKMIPFNRTELKHIIFLSDGEPLDGGGGHNGDPALIGKQDIIVQSQRLANSKITMSTIALHGSDFGNDTSYIEQMATTCGGRFYDVTRQSQLTKIMVEETTVAAGQYHNEVSFIPDIDRHTAATAGIEELPEIGGYYGTRKKNDAVVVLSHGEDPIYAEWSYGKGRVGSFMTDLEGDWGKNYFTDPNGIKFIDNVVKSLLFRNVTEDGRIKVEFSKKNFSTRASITTNFDNGETINSVKLIAPDGTAQDLNFDALPASSYVTEFKAEALGLYNLQITVGGEREEIFNFYTAFSYSAEYNAFADNDECFEFMENLGLSGGGGLLFNTENIFGEENEFVQSGFNPQLTFLIIIVVLFLLDIVVRKFKIKLPKEIREERLATGQEKRNKTTT